MISNLNFLSFEFWNLKLHHTTKWKTKDSQECLGPGFSSEACSFFHRTKIHTRNVWAKNCFFKVAVNWFSSLFFGFGLRRLLSATETTKNQKTSNKNQKKQKKQKNQRILRNVWAKDFVQRHWFFWFFWFSSSFFGFGLWKLLSATKTTKNSKTSKKPKKLKKPKKPKDSEECLGQGLCSEALFLYGFPRVFLVFGSTQKRKDCQECVGNTGFKEMWEPIYGMIAFVFLSCVFPFSSIPDR